MTSAIHSIDTVVNDLDMRLRSCGEGPLVLCLHGFPDSAHTWDDLLIRLAAAGYRAVAPFTRGYVPTGVPGNTRYDAPTLARDALTLAATLSDEPFYLVGHDWGAITGYAAAGAAPERIRAMVTAAVPPTACFLANMCFAQLRRSWYMLFFQLPGIAERALAANDMALVNRLWRDWSPGWDFTDADIAHVKQALGNPASRGAALGYYRALRPLLLKSQQRRAVMAWRSAVATRVIRGREDGCIAPDVFQGSERCFDGAFDMQTFDAGHFMHREQPDAFADSVIEWFGRSHPAC